MSTPSVEHKAFPLQRQLLFRKSTKLWRGADFQDRQQHQERVHIGSVLTAEAAETHAQGTEAAVLGAAIILLLHNHSGLRWRRWRVVTSGLLWWRVHVLRAWWWWRLVGVTNWCRRRNIRLHALWRARIAGEAGRWRMLRWGVTRRQRRLVRLRWGLRVAVAHGVLQKGFARQAVGLRKVLRSKWLLRIRTL